MSFLFQRSSVFRLKFGPFDGTKKLHPSIFRDIGLARYAVGREHGDDKSGVNIEDKKCLDGGLILSFGKLLYSI